MKVAAENEAAHAREGEEKGSFSGVRTCFSSSCVAGVIQHSAFKCACVSCVTPLQKVHAFSSRSRSAWWRSLLHTVRVRKHALSGLELDTDTSMYVRRMYLRSRRSRRIAWCTSNSVLYDTERTTHESRTGRSTASTAGRGVHRSGIAKEELS